MLRRDAGEPREAWTKDRQFQQWRFCQVHREHDRTTVWFRQNVREPLNDHFTDVVEGTIDGLFPEKLFQARKRIINGAVIFRWFNRIETGEKIIDLLVNGWDRAEARRRLLGVSPVVTGAYIIKCGDGLSKLDGVLQAIETAQPHVIKMAQKNYSTLSEAWADLKEAPYMGGFTSYEVISDLRWTPILEDANDIMSWANAGPGCARGLGWLVADNPDLFTTSPKGQREMLPLMQEVLEASTYQIYWPQEWRKWEMREVEHWFCEYDKWRRASEGQSMKRKFSL